jgi:hypothetical protein
VKGFREDKSSVLKFEWRWKFQSRKEKGDPVEKRLKVLENLMNHPKDYIKNFSDLSLNFVRV